MRDVVLIDGQRTAQRTDDWFIDPLRSTPNRLVWRKSGDASDGLIVWVRFGAP